MSHGANAGGHENHDGAKNNKRGLNSRAEGVAAKKGLGWGEREKKYIAFSRYGWPGFAYRLRELFRYARIHVPLQSRAHKRDVHVRFNP